MKKNIGQTLKDEKSSNKGILAKTNFSNSTLIERVESLREKKCEKGYRKVYSLAK